MKNLEKRKKQEIIQSGNDHKITNKINKSPTRKKGSTRHTIQVLQTHNSKLMQEKEKERNDIILNKMTTFSPVFDAPYSLALPQRNEFPTKYIYAVFIYMYK